MSFRRIFIFKCDSCPAEQETDHGFPEDWTWSHGKTNEPIHHQCAACTDCMIKNHGASRNHKDRNHLRLP